MDFYRFADITLKSSIPHLRLIIDNTKIANILPETINTIRSIMSSVADSEEPSSFIILLIENISPQRENFPVATEVLIELYGTNLMKINELESELKK